MRTYKDEKTGLNYIEPTHAEEWLGMLREVAVDYDGYRTPEGLMHLVDELVEYAEKAIECIHEGKIYNPEDSLF